MIEIRAKAGARSESDLTAQVQDATFEYLLTSPAAEIRVSAYLDRDWERVDAKYAELFVQEGCQYLSLITQVTPGSKTRKGISLPGPMKSGEQLTLQVARTPVPGIAGTEDAPPPAEN